MWETLIKMFFNFPSPSVWNTKSITKIVNVSLMTIVEIHDSSHRKLDFPLPVVNQE